MQALIIGCGYLGLRAARAWLSEGHSVAALTRRPERAEQLRSEGLEAVVGDVTQPESLAGLPSADVVLYAVGRDRNAETSQRELYVGGLHNVLQAVGPRAGRLIYISSTSVYGQSHGEWVDETSPCRPVRPNGEVCLDAEEVLKSYCSQQPQSSSVWNILRLAGIYGPGRLLSRVDELKSGRPLSGRPDAFLNLIHVDDAVGAVLACARRGSPGETYLVCDDRPIERREYFALLASLVEAPPAQFDGTPDGGRFTRGLNKRCSNRRMREELGVELKYLSIAEGLPASVELPRDLS